MKDKMHLIKQTINELQNMIEEFKAKALCGFFSIKFNFFKGGICNIEITKTVTEK